MKNFYLTVIGFATLLWVSCKEEPVGIFMGEASLSDTTYLLTNAEAPQAKKYYVEEFTGVECTNCPTGAALLSDLNANNDRVMVINSVHSGSLTRPNYSKGSLQDFRTQDGALLLQAVYGGDPSKPFASFDRLPIGTGSGNLTGSYVTWPSMLEKAKAESPVAPVNITITPEKGVEENTYYIQVKLSYTQAVSGAQHLSVFVLEDSIVDVQIDPYINPYVFNHAFRKSLSPTTGTVILDSIEVKQPGRVLETNYILKIDKTDANQKLWNESKLNIVALVHRPVGESSKAVLQVAEVPLIP